MGGFHFHSSVFVQEYHRFGVHNVFTVTIPLTIVLFHVLNLGVFAHVKGVYAVVAGSHIYAAAVVDTATSYDNDVSVFADMEIVVYHFLQTRFTDNYGDMHTFVFRVWFDIDINTRFAVRFGNDIDICRRVTTCKFAVATDIVRAFGYAVKIGDF